MTKNEMALQLTLKVIELKQLHLEEYTANDRESAEEMNAFNAKQVSDFFNTVSANLGDSK